MGPQFPSKALGTHWPPGHVPPQTFERQPSCLQSLQPVPATRSLRPVPWESSCSVVARHPEGGHHLGPPAFRALLDLQGQQAPQMPVQPGSGKAAGMTWTSGMRSRDSSWMHSTNEAAGTSVHWCNCTTMRQAGWCVRAGEVGIMHEYENVGVQECVGVAECG